MRERRMSSVSNRIDDWAAVTMLSKSEPVGSLSVAAAVNCSRSATRRERSASITSSSCGRTAGRARLSKVTDVAGIARLVTARLGDLVVVVRADMV